MGTERFEFFEELAGCDGVNDMLLQLDVFKD